MQVQKCCFFLTKLEIYVNRIKKNQPLPVTNIEIFLVVAFSISAFCWEYERKEAFISILYQN